MSLTIAFPLWSFNKSCSSDLQIVDPLANLVIDSDDSPNRPNESKKENRAVELAAFAHDQSSSSVFNDWKTPKNQVTNSLPTKFNKESPKKTVYATNDNIPNQRRQKVRITDGLIDDNAVETLNLKDNDILLQGNVSNHLNTLSPSNEIRQDSSSQNFDQNIVDDIEAAQKRLLDEMMGLVVDVTKVSNAVASFADGMSPTKGSEPLFNSQNIENILHAHVKLEAEECEDGDRESSQPFNEQLVANIEAEQLKLLQEMLSFTADLIPKQAGENPQEPSVFHDESPKKPNHDFEIELPDINQKDEIEAIIEHPTPKSATKRSVMSELTVPPNDFQIAMNTIPVGDRSPTHPSVRSPKVNLAIIEEKAEPLSLDPSPDQRKEKVSVFNPERLLATETENHDSKLTSHFPILIPNLADFEGDQSTPKNNPPVQGSKAQLVQGGLAKLHLASHSSELEIASVGTPSQPLFSAMKDNTGLNLISPFKSPLKYTLTQSTLKPPTLPRRPATRAYKKHESSATYETKKIPVAEISTGKLGDEVDLPPLSVRSNKTDFRREPVFGKMISSTHSKQMSSPGGGIRHAESLKQSKVELPIEKHTQITDSDKQVGGNSLRHAEIRGSEIFTPSKQSSIPSFNKDGDKVKISKDRRPQLSKLQMAGDQTPAPDQHQSVLKKTGISGFDLGLKSAHTFRQSTAKRQLKFAFAPEVSSDSSSSDEGPEHKTDSMGYKLPPKLIVGRKSTNTIEGR